MTSPNSYESPLFTPSPVLTRQLIHGELQSFMNTDMKFSGVNINNKKGVEYLSPGNYKRKLLSLIRKIKSINIAPKTRNPTGLKLTRGLEISKANLLNNLQNIAKALDALILFDAAQIRNERRREKRQLKSKRLTEGAQIINIDCDDVTITNFNIENNNNENTSHILSNEVTTNNLGNNLTNQLFSEPHSETLDDLEIKSEGIEIDEFDARTLNALETSHLWTK
jgi:hypothetical protein